jgi:hypothetical protein
LNQAFIPFVLQHRENEIEVMHDDFKENVAAIKRNLLRFINVLYTSYLNRYVKKEQPPLNPFYSFHTYKLHTIYHETKKSINKSTVTAYVYALPIETVFKIVFKNQKP